LPPFLAPSKSFGAARVKAEMRWGSVKVWYNSDAGARNSSVSVTVVVFTEELPLLVCVVVAIGAGPLGTWILGVDTPLEGPEPGACWMSLPCSAMRAGPSFANSFRSCGTILARTRSLTGAFELASE